MADGKLIVVSNRLPLSIRRGPDGWIAEPSAGGLASAVNPILKARGGLWIGWPGPAPPDADAGREQLLEKWRTEHGFVGVDLPAELAQRFYEGYANQTLWPLFHNFATNFEADPDGWAAYVAANRRFRDAVLEHLGPGDTVWVHDYHLMLLPRLIRDVAPETRVGFFLHIPFPASETFRILPHCDEVLRGLLGADLVAFQTHLDLQHFRSSLLRLLGLSSRPDRVTAQGGSTRLDALPIGIAPDEFAGVIENDRKTQKAFEQLRRRYEGLRILLGVDRLDYTKGIPQRLRAYRKLLQRAPQLRGKIVLVQVAVPSRERIPEYDRLRQAVNSLVGEVNGEFGTPDWTPVVYIRRAIPRSELVALYAAAEVGWVTPLRDGMNLVAKEYVACQRRGEGVLLLSEFAGAAAEMGEAFIVNPYDEERVASVLERVLDLPREERRERMAMLYQRVLRNTVFRWGERFLGLLDEAARGRLADRPERPAALPVAPALEAFRASRSRLVLLDYDGTLVPFAPRPAEAVPPPRVVELLRSLASAPGVTAAIVSGRSRHDLETWFGDVPELWLIGEHGACMRSPVTREWEMARPHPGTNWKKRFLPVLEHFIDRTPGSFLEEKELAVVWHHRMADPEFGEWLANELVSTLDEMLADTELQAIRGNKTVEVRFAWANKGAIVDRLQSLRPDADFRLAIGDDRTDEDLFQRLRAEAWTVRVGEGTSSARYSLDSPVDVIAFLEALVSAAAPPALRTAGKAVTALVPGPARMG